MKYVNIQVQELISGRMVNINHPFNKDEREGIDVTIPADELAKVKHSIGMTLNLGDYQSAKVEVGIELPCHVGEVQDKYEEASTFSNDKLMEEVATLVELKKVFGKK